MCWPSLTSLHSGDVHTSVCSQDISAPLSTWYLICSLPSPSLYFDRKYPIVTVLLCNHLAKILSLSLQRTRLQKKIGFANGPGAKLLSGKASLVTMLQRMTLLSRGDLYAESATNGTRTNLPPPLVRRIQIVRLVSFFRVSN